ncbi:DUF1800 family protein [Telluria aromaticivorans]|uniref:DUF1800 domain-containing protein n=1 Tax=Telluria aromaticivorans TaxID=2725995 RepID=A0A7Y2NYJ2_9BURK|nr:DUF1800 family protein [Telluria aromaticivorans]NNG22872.1 DUF1800 domain-containing protein [Telluria aromaticivorans]
MRSCPSFLRFAVPALLAVALLCAPGARADEAIDEATALHLLNRLGYGPAPGDLARVRAMGLRVYVDSQLAPPALPAYIEAQLRQPAATDAGAREERLLRAIASPRQLEEVLCAFWLAHFGIMEGKGLGAAGIGAIAREAVRPHVFGSYAALRSAVARHPGMQGRRLGGRSEHDAVRALAAHFVSAPPAALVRSLAGVWRQTGADQRAVLRTLFTSPAFLAQAEAGSKRKDALRFVVSAVRASGIAVTDTVALAEVLAQAGSPVYGRMVPMDSRERTDFVTRLAEGRVLLAAPAPRAHEQASMAPPLRATVEGAAPQGEVAQPGPVLMEAPTPAAAAMAAARNRPADADGLKEALLGEAFLRY